MLEDKEFKALYKKDFDSICASNELKNAVKNLKPQKPRRVVTPFKAALGTVAAAVMIFAAVHDYSFEKDTSGVISETVVSTELPEAQFEIVEKEQSKPYATANATQKPKAVNAVTVTPAPTKMPVVTPAATQGVAEPENNETAGVMSLRDNEPSLGRAGGEYIPPSVEMWTVEQYYAYLGTNVSQKIAGRYTGAQTLEFEVGSDGVPLDDTAVLNFTANSGASIRATVSKHVLFDAALSGTVTDAGNGYNAYKVSGGVYYNIYATNTTRDEVIALINNL